MDMIKSKFTHSVVSEKFTRLSAIVVIVIGVLVLIGWYSKMMFLTRFSINEVPMAPSTAYVFIFIAAGLWFYLRPQKIVINRNAAIASAVITIGLSLLIIVTNILKYYGNWEHSFVTIPDTQLSMQLGHMSLVTAILFFISGFALLFLLSNRKIVKTFSIILTLIIFIISFVLLLGYAFGAPFFYFDNFIPPAVLTVLSFLLVSLGLIAASDKNTFFIKAIWKTSTSAKLLRIFLPTTLAIIVIEGLIVIRILPLLDIHPAIGISVVSLIVVAVVIVVISIISKSMGKTLDSTLENLTESKQQFRTLVENIPGSTYRCLLDESWTMLYISNEIQNLTGYPKSDFIGENPKRAFASLMHPDDIQPIWENTNKAINEKHPFINEYRVIDKSGSTHFVYARGQAVFNEEDNPIYLDGTIFDITEQKQADKDRKKNQILLQQAEEIANQGAWEWDIIQDEWTFSENWLRVHGCRLSGITREELMTLAYPEDAPKVEKAFQDALKGGSPYKIEHRIIRQNDGKVRYVRALGNLILNDSGQPYKMYGVAQDITEQKQAEQELKESEAQLRTITNNLPVLISQIDKDLKYTFVNQYYYNRSPFQSEIIGKNVIDVMGEETFNRALPHMKKALSGESVSFENRTTHTNNNELIIFETNYIPHFVDGKVESFFVLGMVITERKKAEEVLKLSEQKFKNQVNFLDTIINQSPIAMWISDSTGTLIRSNQALRTILNVTDEQIIGKFNVLSDKNMKDQGFSTLVKAVYEDFQPARFVMYWIGEKVGGDYDYTNIKPLWVDIAMFPIVGENGELIHVVCQYLDITERKLAEEKEKTLHSNIDLLSKTAMNFVEFPQDGNIYDFVGEHIREFVGENAYIVINSVDRETGFSTIESVLGAGKLSKMITNKLGGNPVGMKFDVKDSNVHYQDGKLHVFQEGLYGLLLKTVPKGICKSIEKLANINKIYVIDLAKKEQFFGSIIILLKEKTAELKNKRLIETFIKQASIAILKRQAEEDLRINEDKLNLIFNSSPVGICTVDSLGNFITTNPAYEQMVGYSKEECRSLSFFDVTHPNDRPKNKKLFQDMFSLETKDFSIEKRYIRKDGEEIKVSVHAIGIRDAEGNIRFGTAFVDDITERKRAEEALKVSEENIKNTFNLSPSIISKANIDTGYFVEANQAVTRILGYSVEEFTSTPIVEMIHPSDIHRSTDEIEAQLKGKEVTFFENRYLCKDGSYKWMAWHGTKADNHGMVTAIGSDITKRKQAEQKILEALEMASNAEVIAKMGNWSWNPNTNEVLWSDNMCRLYGIEPSEFDPTFDYANRYTHPDDLDYVSKIIERLLTEKKPQPSAEYRILTPDNKTVWVEGTTKLLFDEKGEISEIVGTTQDITERKQIQEMIMAKNKEMENYLYIASHDLRTPLVNIQGFSQRLKKQADSIKTLFVDKTLEPETLHQLGIITDEDIPKTLSFVLSNIEKMDTLINGLLQLSRTGRVEMNIQKIDMNELFANIIQSLDFQIKEAKCEIKINPLPECYGDAALLDQLFANIISNALKYSDSERTLEITVGAKKTYNRVVYTIKDNGIGIEQKHLDKIWDIFYRIDPRSDKTGDGIGLSLVKRIAEKHNGKVWAESEVNIGSVFHIEIQNRTFTES